MNFVLGTGLFSVENYYDNLAEDYDQAVRAWGYCLPEACIDSLVKHAQFDLKDTNVNVLDLGCGAGKNNPSFLRFYSFLPQIYS